MPQLRNAGAERRPAVSTLMGNNHAVITKQWRYIRYQDGSEELYDRVKDPDEFRNLAGQAEVAAVKQEHARWVPQMNAPFALERDDYEFNFERYEFKKKAGR